MRTLQLSKGYAVIGNWVQTWVQVTKTDAPVSDSGRESAGGQPGRAKKPPNPAIVRYLGSNGTPKITR